MNIVRYFPYLGPSRRSDFRVVEIQLDCDAEAFEKAPMKTADVRQLLINERVLKPADRFPSGELPRDYGDWFPAMLGELVILLQQKGGHRVSHYERVKNHLGVESILLVEYAHCDVGMTAAKLAAKIMLGSRQSLTEPFGQFVSFARQRMVPRETDALIRAASRKGIPVSRLEHQPLSQGLGRKDCIRPFGLVRFGHGSANRVLDGTFIIDRSSDYLRALRKNPGLRERLLLELGVPKSDPGQHRPNHLVVVCGTDMLAVELSKGAPRSMAQSIHQNTRELLLEIAERCAGMPVAVYLDTPDIGAPLSESGGAITGFTLAPDLAEISAGGNVSGLIDEFAGLVIDTLIPDPQQARMPIFAVTGTNGKTTTCRLIAWILKQAGYRPGLVSTDGVYLDGNKISHEDASAFIGHARVLASKEVDAAVLENHHTGIAIRGFAFDHCDVGVCLNVTHDHVEEGEIDSVEHLSRIKSAVPARASKAAVLFADNPHTRAMVGGMEADEVGLVSLEATHSDLEKLLNNRRGKTCVLETSAGAEHMVLYDGSKRFELPALADIPITYAGTARFMVSNAMHAALATWQFGIEPEQIAKALTEFLPGPESTPGRLNIFEELGFRIIIDYGHNPDGMRAIAEFADRQEVAGRKIVAFSGSARRDEATRRMISHALAGHFDLYFCKEYTVDTLVEHATVGFQKDCLMECGVSEQDIRLTTTGQEAFFEIFDACSTEDLLILLVGTEDLKHFGAYIKEYARIGKSASGN